MGSGYNTSLAAGRSARGKARTRTPIWFWLDAPLYVYELPCGGTWDTGDQHLFRSRTPATSFGGEYTFWCERCQQYRSINALTHQPINRDHSTDEVVAWEQDKGILRERIGRWLQDRGYLETEAEIAETAARNWAIGDKATPVHVPVTEIRRINVGLTAAPGQDGLPDVCAAGLHEMNPGNTAVESSGRRTCRACRLVAQSERKRRQRARERAQKQDQKAPDQGEQQVSRTTSDTIGGASAA